MTKRTFDELTFSKIAFLAGYTDVYHNDNGQQEEIATPNQWVTDSTVINDFAFNNNIELEQTDTDEGDLYHVTEDSGDFLNEFKVEINIAEELSVDEILEEKRNELKKQTV